jgi:hypothetical protein
MPPSRPVPLLLVLLGLTLLCCAAPTRVYWAPHSHCDAGWKDTFEGYYQSLVKRILNTIVDYMAVHDNTVFNWCEIGYLHRWYQDADNTARHTQFDALVAAGRIVFASGGWVQVGCRVARWVL